MYTNAQVAELVKAFDRKLDRALAQGSVPAGAPVADLVIASPVVIPERTVKAARYSCSLHADHKGGKGYSANGIAYHRANGCAGVTTQI